ncbi:hypothetical protein [Methylacidimicrobium cyclopophantes]|nr:hypothetical protein [Methylacidimicrobium cyclopophantes]
MPRRKQAARTERKPEIEWRPIGFPEGGLAELPPESMVIWLTLTALPSPKLIVESPSESDLASIRYRDQRTGEWLVWYRCAQCGTLAFTNLRWESSAQLRVYHAGSCQLEAE